MQISQNAKQNEKSFQEIIYFLRLTNTQKKIKSCVFILNLVIS